MDAAKRAAVKKPSKTVFLPTALPFKKIGQWRLPLTCYFVLFRKTEHFTVRDDAGQEFLNFRSTKTDLRKGFVKT
jgi:hypothetical protein